MVEEGKKRGEVKIEAMRETRENQTEKEKKTNKRELKLREKWLVITR
jgi:hypothetical protein